MKIIASSLQTQLEGFLHPGYISGLPEPHGLAAAAYGNEPPAMQLDMAEALRLQVEQATIGAGAQPSGAELEGTAHGASTAIQGGMGLVGSVASNLSELWLAAAVLALFGLAALLYLMRAHWSPRRQWLAAGAVATVAAVAIVGWTFGLSESRAGPAAVDQPIASLKGAAAPSQTATAKVAPSPAPSAAPGPYAEPELATRALLHGILAGALINSRSAVRSLEKLREQVALPTIALTKGQRYALAHYDADGWGRDFRFAVHGKWQPYRYTVTSAGADGRFDSADDLQLNLEQSNDRAWSNQRYAYFIVRDGPNIALAFRRAPYRSFVHRNQARARALTGSEHFDLLLSKNLTDEQRRRVKTAYARHQRTSKSTNPPLVLQVIPAPAMGTATSYRYASMHRRWQRHRRGDFRF